VTYGEEVSLSGELKGKIVAVTGAGSGIGRATALAFAAAGARVVASDIMPAGLDETAALIRAAGYECVTVVADVAKRSDVDSLVAACLELDGLDAMVANAGVSLDRPFLEVTEQDLDRTFAVNLKGVFFCGQAAAQAMIGLGRGGSIVNVASIYGEVAAEGCAAYCASKGGVRMLTNVMALELGRHGIRVNAVAPGYIRTAMNPMDDPQEERRIAQTVPLGRVGEPKDIADVILWLTTEGARYVDGQTVFADGGWIAQ
jgi:NAD(P)-dependent dehydrogenase (short-subunit alcohol dehydrogenase family)